MIHPPAARHLDSRSLAESERRALGPWTPDSLVAVVSANAVGAVLIVVGGWVAHGQDTPGAQLGWLNLSITGLVLAGAANGWWVSRGRRSIRLAFGAVLVEGRQRWDGGAGSDGATATASDLVSVPRAQRYHRSSCALVAGKEIFVAARSRHQRDGRQPCEVCDP